ncbi:MAG: Gldg family protein [Proteobacteria bacterium]|nr:Gldg family protein [Pseudomonadota bacterium]
MAGWAALLGGLGGVAICFAMLIALISAFQPVADLTWVWGNLVIGVVLLGSALVASFETLRERLGSGESRRASRYGTSALVSTLLGIAILGMLAFLVTRYATRWDWTEQKVHTLTDQTQKVLDGLDRDVQVTAFFSELQAPPVRDLLQMYQFASDRVVLEFADPNARPDLILKYDIDEALLSRGLVRIALGDDAVLVSEFTEPKITNALVQLSRSSDKKVYFLTGHNERVIDGEDAEGKEGFKEAAQALRNENYEVANLLIAQFGDVPEDADVVVLAGPTRRLPPEEISALDRYVARGGALLVMLDPRANTNVAEVLERWDISVGDDIIVDLQLAFFQQYFSPFAGAYAANHPITKEMGEQQDPTLFHNARSVQASDGGDSAYEVLVYTGDKSWAERDIEQLESSGQVGFGGDDLKGPVPVAIAGEIASQDGAGGDEDGASPARIVVVGDSDFATNEFMVRYGGNRDLFVNSVNWLLGDVEAISVRPHQSRASRFVGSQQEVQAIQYLSIFVLPEAIAVLGVAAWWWRRKSPGR